MLLKARDFKTSKTEMEAALAKVVELKVETPEIARCQSLKDDLVATTATYAVLTLLKNPSIRVAGRTGGRIGASLQHTVAEWILNIEVNNINLSG